MLVSAFEGHSESRQRLVDLIVAYSLSDPNLVWV